MSSHKLTWTDTFTRTARKFLKKNPHLRGVFEDVVTQLSANPRDPRLRIHRLRGKHKDKHAVSLTYSYRIVFILIIKKRKIILVDVGSHDDVYK